LKYLDLFLTVRKEEGRGRAKANKGTGGTLRACEGILHVVMHKLEGTVKKC